MGSAKLSVNGQAVAGHEHGTELLRAAHEGTGATFSPESLTAAVERANAAGDKFDAVVFNAALQFFADPRAALAGAVSVLTPGPASRLVWKLSSGYVEGPPDFSYNFSYVCSRNPSNLL